MKISFDSKSTKTDAFVAFAAEGGKLLEPGKWADKKTHGALKRAIAAENFEGKKAQVLVLPGPDGMPHQATSVILGVGKPDALKPQDFEKLGSAIVSVLNQKKAASAEMAFCTDGLKFKDFDGHEAAARMASGALLNAYRFDKYLTREPKDKKPTLKSISFTCDEPQKAKKIFAEAKKSPRPFTLPATSCRKRRTTFTRPASPTSLKKNSPRSASRSRRSA